MLRYVIKIKEYTIKKTNEGSLLVSMLILFIFMSALIGIVIRNATFFSSLVFKKQLYTIHTYAADALLQYGIAYVQENYDAIIENLSESAGNNKQQPSVMLSFSAWPVGIDLYAGIITIEQKKEKELESGVSKNKKLVVRALLYEKGVLPQKDLALEKLATPLLELQCTVVRHNNSITISCYINMSSL